MGKGIATLAAVSALSLSAVVSGPVMAAAPQAGYVGQVQSSVAGCPNIMWRLARHNDGKITGIIYYADMSGASMANGMMEGGKFKITTTSSMGNGPVGTVEGTRSSQGKVEAQMVGEGCANATFKANPIADLNTYDSTG